MRTILNIITILFVAGSVYYIATTNNVPELAEGYIQQYKASIGRLKQEIPNTLSTLDTSMQTTIPGMTPLKQAIQAPSVLPDSISGTLQKIKTIIIPPVAVTPPAGSTASVGALSVKGVIADTNAERQKQSVAALTESAKLDASAKAKADDILTRQYFAHIAPDGKTVSDTTAAQGYTYIKIGENLALGDFTSDSDLVTAWMNSPEHRANILDPDFTDMGVGVSYGMYQGRNTYVAVQHFGRPRSACPTVDSALRVQVENGQANLDAEVKALNDLKIQIDQGRAQNKDMNAQVDIYNQDLARYTAEFSQIDSLRIAYNKEVTAFNSCLASL